MNTILVGLSIGLLTIPVTSRYGRQDLALSGVLLVTDCLTRRFEESSGSYYVYLTNSCDSRVWYKACYAGRDDRNHKDWGYVNAGDTLKSYLLMSGPATPGTFEWNEGVTASAIDYPDACSQ